MRVPKRKSDFKLITDTPYLASPQGGGGGVLGVFIVSIWEKTDRVITAPHST